LGSQKLIHSLTLLNGLKVSIYDHTKVYFGDYHYVRVKIICSLDSTAVDWNQLFPECIDLQSISYTRTLGKMGVPSEDIESVTKTLLAHFDYNSLPYISAADFPTKMIKNELSCKKLSVRKYRGSGS
jgi:hypothetical protein